MFRWNMFHLNMFVNELFTTDVSFKPVSYLGLIYAVLLYLHKFLVSCRRELENTVRVAFILCGLSLNFLLFRTFVPGCEFWLCIAMLCACNRCY